MTSFYLKDASGSWRELTDPINNSISSSANGTELATARITFSGGTPAVAQQDGSWISSLDDNGTGDTTIHIAGGTFSADPNCFVTNIASNTEGRFVSAPTVSSARWNSFTSAGAAQDGDFSIMCVGAR